MKGTAIVDPGKGRVYNIPIETLARGRAMVRGPYLRDCHIVLDCGKTVESYKPGTGLKERRVA